MEDYLFLFNAPAPAAASSLLKQFLSNSNSNQENIAHYSTFCLLNKASILHSIREGTADASVSEGILDSLQIIEQLDRQQGLPPSDAMRAAFCAVAVHCTLKSLPLSWPCYFDAVQRIWRFRIRNLDDSTTSQLLGPDLTKWRDDVEAALWDSDTSQRLLRINTHHEALHRIRVFLGEALSSMKPAFLRLALSSTAGPTVDPVSSAFASVQTPPRPHRCADKGKRILRVNSQTRCKLPASRRRYRGPVIIADSDEDRPSCSEYGNLSTSEVNKQLQDALKSNTVILLAGVTNFLPEAVEVAERVASDIARKNLHAKAGVEDSNMNKGYPATSFSPTTHCCTDKGILMVNSQTTCDLGSSPGNSNGPVIIADTEDRPSCRKYGSLSTREINEMREALKSSIADLLAAVTDPLPEALEVAERIASYMAGKNLHTEAVVGDENKDKVVPATSVTHAIEPALAKRVARDLAGKKSHVRAIRKDHDKMDKSVPAPSVNDTAKPVEAEEGSEAFIRPKRVLRPSLMERNGTACTYEWEDSIDGSAEEKTSCSNRCRLPSPKTKHVSPLKERETKKWARKRKINRWTLEEEKALAEGTVKYGTHWKLILASNPEVFRNRTPVDLKDKWRNMGGK